LHVFSGYFWGFGLTYSSYVCANFGEMRLWECSQMDTQTESRKPIL